MISYMKATFGNPLKVWDGKKPARKRWLGAVSFTVDVPKGDGIDDSITANLTDVQSISTGGTV